MVGSCVEDCRADEIESYRKRQLVCLVEFECEVGAC